MDKPSSFLLLSPVLLTLAGAPGCTPEECLSQDLAANALAQTEIDSILSCMRPTFEAVVSGLERCQRDPATGETMGTSVVYNDQVCAEWSAVEDSTCPNAESNAEEAMGHLIEKRGDDTHPDLFREYSGEGYYIGGDENGNDGGQICGGWVAVAGYSGYYALAPKGLDTTRIALEACVGNNGRSFEAIVDLEEQAGGSCATWED